MRQNNLKIILNKEYSDLFAAGKFKTKATNHFKRNVYFFFVPFLKLIFCVKLSYKISECEKILLALPAEPTEKKEHFKETKNIIVTSALKKRSKTFNQFS